MSTTSTLLITSSTPIHPLVTPLLIDGNASIDERSAVDQFLDVFSTLNVLVSRRGVDASNITLQGDQNEGHIVDLDAVESLYAIDYGESDLEPTEVDDISEEVITSDGVGSTTSTEVLQMPETISSANLTPSTASLSYQLNNLVFLGYISAVESYLRCLTRQVVLADEFTADRVADQKISFGAALHSVKELLPEAFLEEISFISKESVDKLLTQFMGIKTQKLIPVLEEYSKICQLRHCIVHRFGKLGTNNAIKLGLRTHKALFEKPIQITEDDLSKIGHTLVNLVKAINNNVYEQILERSANNSEVWSWDLRKDKKTFSKFYQIFASELAPTPSPSIKDAYKAFRTKCREGSATTKASRRTNAERQ